MQTTQSPPTSVPVPPLNLAGSYAALREELDRELLAVAQSGGYVLGPKVAAFEEALARYCGAKFALGLSSGTDALLCAMMALDIGPGDEVIVPTFTFFATAGTVARLGAKPVFCDVDPVTFNIDPRQLAERITPRTRAVMPVHLYGQLADMDAIGRIAAKHSLPIIEDAAQAIGATERSTDAVPATAGGTVRIVPGADATARPSAAAGAMAGAIGTFGALSFYPTKNLGALGDAGALLTNDEKLFELARKLRIHGSGHTYYHERVGGNFRIDAIQAAVLSIKLRRLEEWTSQRRARAHRYGELLAETGVPADAISPPREVFGRHVYHQYVLRVRDRRDELAEFLKSRQIGCGVYYPLPLHLQKCFGDLGGKPGDFPQAERAAREVLALPIYPELTEAQQSAVIGAIREFVRRGT